MPIGSLINILTVLAGGSIGTLLNNRLPENIKKIIFQGLGLIVTALGLQMSFACDNVVLVISSVVLGAIIGESLDLDGKVSKAVNKFKNKIHSNNQNFTEGFVAGFLLICVGSMSILGPLNEGLHGDRSIVLTKAFIDGFSAMSLSATFGPSVLLVVFPIMIIQFSLTLLAGNLQSFFNEGMILHLTAVGGILVFGAGLGMLEIKKMKMLNFIPALLIALILAKIFPC